MNVEKIRRDFPFLQKKLKGMPIRYFDNSCMTLRPTQVINAMNEYYLEYPSCALRSHHKLSNKATEEVEKARVDIQKFIGAKKTNEVVFTKNTTEAINIVSNGFELKRGDVVLTTDKEHNSNHIPWLKLARDKGVKREIVLSNEDNTFSIENFEKVMRKDVKLVSIVHKSNMDGVKNPLKEIIKISHDHGAKVLVDAAQSAPHIEVDFKKLNADFLAFSAHKMLGPSGMGALIAKQSLLEEIDQFIVGGETVKEATYKSFVVENIPHKFEAGLQNYSGMLGFAAAAEYLSKVGLSNIEKHEIKLNKKLSEGLLENGDIKLLGPINPELRGGIASFYVPGKDVHEIAMMADSISNVMLRSGAHCVHSWFNAHKLMGSVRASLYLYNTKEEVEVFLDTMKEILSL